MADFVSSIRRLALIIIILIVAGSSILYAITQLFPEEPTTMLINETVRNMIVISFGLLIVFFIRRSTPLLSKHVGAHLSLVFQFFTILVVGIVVVFS